MKRFYFELKLGGRSITVYSLAEALSYARKHIAMQESCSPLFFRVFAQSSTFPSGTLQPKFVDERVSEIPIDEYNELNNKVIIKEWAPKCSLKKSQLRDYSQSTSPSALFLFDIPSIVNRTNSTLHKVENTATLSLGDVGLIDISFGDEWVWTVSVFYEGKKSTVFVLEPVDKTENTKNASSLKELFNVIRERGALECKCSPENIEIKIDDNLKGFIQKVSRFLELQVKKKRTSRYVKPKAKLDAIIRSKKYLDEFEKYIDRIAPAENKFHSSDSTENLNTKIENNYGILSNFTNKDTAQMAESALKRIIEVEGCICTTFYKRIAESYMALHPSTAGFCNDNGEVQIKEYSIKEKTATEKYCKQVGWHSTDKVIGTFIHEDTHAMMDYIIRMLGRPYVNKRLDGFASLLQSLRDREQCAVLSRYGAKTCADGTPYGEMVAEARAEVLCEGRNARAFSRKVYAVLMLLYEKALSKEKK